MDTHAPIIAQPNIEAVLLDGGVNLLAGVLILVAGWILSRWASRCTHAGLDRLHHFDETLKPLLSSLVRYGILGAAIIAVLERFGVETTSLIALLGAAGIAIGLALQGTLSNVAAGVMLIVLRPFRIGDAITVTSNNISGSVREIGLFTTLIISADQALLSVPNSAIFSGPITNSSYLPTTRSNFSVFVDYGNDIDAALNIIREIVKSDARTLKNPAPTAAVQTLKDDCIELVVRFWTSNSDAEPAQFAVKKTIWDRFRKAGLTMPSRFRPIVVERGERMQAPALRKSG